MNEEASAVVIELSRNFIELLRHLEPKWDKGYFRFCDEGVKYGSNASFVRDSEAFLIDPFADQAFFDRMNKNGVRLLELIGKDQGLFVLIVDSQFNYDIKFEFQNLARWRITKLDGGTGVPEGI